MNTAKLPMTGEEKKEPVVVKPKLHFVMTFVLHEVNFIYLLF